MPEYPIFVKLSGLPVLIVGGGKVALRKARGLLDSGALVNVISPEFDPGLDQLPDITRIRQAYTSGWLSKTENPRWRLVFAATNDPEANALAGADAAAAGIFFCRCDDAGQGEFTGAATARRGPITIAVSTGGASPALAAEMANSLAAGIPQHRLDQAVLVEQWRPRILAFIGDPSRRQVCLKMLTSAELVSILQQGGLVAGERWLSTRINPVAAPERLDATPSPQAKAEHYSIQEIDD